MGSGGRCASHRWSGVKMKIRKAHECIGPPTFAKDAKVGHPPNYPTQAKTGLGWGTLPRYRMTTSWQLSLLLLALGARWMISRSPFVSGQLQCFGFFR